MGPKGQSKVMFVAVLLGVLLIGVAFATKDSEPSEASGTNPQVQGQGNADSLLGGQVAERISDLENQIAALQKDRKNDAQKQAQTYGSADSAGTASDEDKYILKDAQYWLPGSEAIAGTIPRGTKVSFVKSELGFTTVTYGGREVLVLADYLAESMTPNTDLSEIVETWEPFAVFIFCEFTDAYGETYYGRGSGTDYNGVVVTNRHVLLNDEGYGPTSCALVFPGNDHVFIEPISSIKVATDGSDWGTVTVSDRSLYIKKQPPNGIHGCYGPEPSIGDDVVILGYPGIGSDSSITVTRGIISGREGSYFVSDAKIDQGNSGGTAILVKSNCYLGIPTFAVPGLIESLGRILDIRTVPVVGRG